jgi:hypothetical protein
MFLKCLKKVALIAGLMVGAMGAAQAVPVYFADLKLGPQYLLQGQTYTYTHNILSQGYNPAKDTLLSASLSIWVYDDLVPDVWDWSPFDNDETVGFRFDNGQWIKEDVEGWLLDPDVFTFTLTSQLVDGLLNVTIKAFKGDFVFGGSLLQVVGDRASVPEPATLGLFGLGMLAAGFGARRRAAR